MTNQGRLAVAASAPAGLRRAMRAGEITRALQVVAEWDHAEQEIARSRRTLVQDLRGRGASWDTVGWVLGTTGSAARQRFGARR